jgi:uncharacterized membrane protein YdbT with pleckstrin-like domain
MDNNTLEYKRLGHKTFLLFFLRRTALLFLIALLEAAILFFYSSVPTEYTYIANIVILALLGLFILIALLALLLAWMQYTHYKIFISADNIKINRGLIDEEELGLPFRRIKEANLERSLMDQLFGVSNVVLMVLGEEEGDSLSKESKIILDSLDNKIATRIQEILLNKSEVEEVNMSSNAISQTN